MNLRKIALLFLIPFFVISGKVFSQNLFTVEAIDSIPDYKAYFIKVSDGERTLSLISYYYLNNENAENKKEDSLFVGSKILLNLKLLSLDDNPLPDFMKKPVGRHWVLMYEGKKIHNMKEPLYYSDCMRGLKLIIECE